MVLAKPTKANHREELLDALLALQQDDGDNGKIVLKEDDDDGNVLKQTDDNDDNGGIVLEQDDEPGDGRVLSKLDLKALEKAAEKDAKSQYYYHHRYYYHGHYYYHPYHVVHVHIHHHHYHYGKK